MKHAFLALPFLVLAACQEESVREVVEAQSPNGQPFHFMNITEDDVSDITIVMAWPSDWAYDATVNPAVPTRPQDVMELFNDNNAGGWLTPSTDFIYGELGFPKEHIDEVVSIAAEMLATPQFDEAWVDRIKQNIEGNQADSRQDTGIRMWETARAAVLGDQPILDSLGLISPENINAVTVDDLRDWHARTLTQTDVIIAVTGAISEADAGRAIDQVLAGLPVGAPVPQPAIDLNIPPKRVYLHLPEAEKTTLGFLSQLPPTSEGGDLIDLLALAHFSSGLESPLNKAIRTELRASYGFQAGYANYDRAMRVMFIAGEVESEKLNEAVDVILETYESHRIAPDLEGFDSLKEQSVIGTKENVDYVDVAANTILQFVMDGQDPTQTPRLDEVMAEITQDDVINRLADIYPAGDQLFIVAAGPLPDGFEGACVVTSPQDAFDC